MNKRFSGEGIPRAKLAFLAGSMFCLAGAVELITGLHERSGERTPEILAVLFFCVAFLWIAIGVKFKKEDL